MDGRQRERAGSGERGERGRWIDHKQRRTDCCVLATSRKNWSYRVYCGVVIPENKNQTIKKKKATKHFSSS